MTNRQRGTLLIDCNFQGKDEQEKSLRGAAIGAIVMAKHRANDRLPNQTAIEHSTQPRRRPRSGHHDHNRRTEQKLASAGLLTQLTTQPAMDLGILSSCSIQNFLHGYATWLETMLAVHACHQWQHIGKLCSFRTYATSVMIVP